MNTNKNGPPPQLHQMLAEAKAHIEEPKITLPLSFDFSWNMHSFSALFEKAEGDDFCTIELTSNLGTLPFSAESPEARRRIMSLSQKQQAGRHDLVQISNDNTICLMSTTRSDAPESLADCIVGLSLIILSMESLLNELEDALHLQKPD